MRLKFFDKIMLYVLLTALSIFSLIIILLACGAAEPVTISNYTYVLFGSIVNKLILIVLGAAIIAVCVRILFVRKPVKVVNEQEELSHKRGVTVDMGEGGNVFVTYSAIENAVINLVCEEPHVTECQCVLVPSGDGISIAVKVILNYGAAVTQTSKNITMKLTRDIERRMGIKVYGVKITVDTPVKQQEDPKAKQRAAQQQKPIPAQYALNEPVAVRPNAYYGEPLRQQPQNVYQQPQFDPNAMPFETVFQASRAQRPAETAQPQNVYQQPVSPFEMEFVPQSAPAEPAQPPVNEPVYSAVGYDEAAAYETTEESGTIAPQHEKAPAQTEARVEKKDPNAGMPFDPMAFLNENAVAEEKTVEFTVIESDDEVDSATETVEQQTEAPQHENQQSEGQRRRSRKAQRQAKANANNYAQNTGNDAK